jgi:hypothetical protein
MNEDQLIELQQKFLLLTDEWQKENYSETGWFAPEAKCGVYGAALTIWLMILQGLHGCSMTKALGLIQQGAADVLLSQNEDSKKARTKALSTNSGGYSRAKSRLPQADVEEILSVVNKGLITEGGADPVVHGYRVYVIDGTNFVVERTRALEEEYPRGRNQHGKLNHPEMLSVFATELVSGVGTNPQFGAVRGKDAASEKVLSATVIEEIESGALLMGDRGFGIFAVVSHAVSTNKEVLVRLKEARALKLLKSASAQRVPADGTIDVPLVWQKASWDEKLSSNDRDEVKGRLIRVTVKSPGFRPVALCFFTTTELSVEQVLELYEQRVTIETDIRYLKHTFKMERVLAKTPEALRKELLIRFMAFNLLRRVISDAALKVGLLPRQLSFTKAAMYTQIFGTKIMAATTAKARKELYEHYLKIIRQCRLPQRPGKRYEPRMITRLTHRFSVMHGARNEARKRWYKDKLLKDRTSV